MKCGVGGGSANLVFLPAIFVSSSVLDEPLGPIKAMMLPCLQQPLKPDIFCKTSEESIFWIRKFSPTNEIYEIPLFSLFES